MRDFPISIMPEEESLLEVDPTREIVITTTDFSFIPSDITVQAGEPARIVFRNMGNEPHNWGVEEFRYLRSLVIAPGDSDTFEFIVPEERGTFTVYCSVPGHRENDMVGAMHIE